MNDYQDLAVFLLFLKVDQINLVDNKWKLKDAAGDISRGCVGVPSFFGGVCFNISFFMVGTETRFHRDSN